MVKGISVASRKAKGRNLQNLIRDKLVEHFVTYGKQCQADDLTSTVMGESGADIKLSPRGKEVIRMSIECKAKKTHGVYKYYEQAKGHYPELEPVVFIKQDRSKPLVIVDADYFIGLLRIY